MLTAGKAFTLLELLVVTTIMIVLISILVPAMQAAIYQAELAVCSTQLKVIADGAFSYTTDAKRFYPDRVAGESQADMLADGAPSGPDDRPLLRTMFSVNQTLNDPVSARVNLDTVRESSVVYANRQMYFDFAFEGFAGMRRLGDQFEWEGVSFSVIACDLNYYIGGALRSSHLTTRNQRSVPESAQDEEVDQGAGLPGSVAAMAGLTVYQTYSRWADYPSPFGTAAGVVDLNYGYTDGSVHRVTDVAFDDARMWVVPMFSGRSAWPSGPSATNGWYSLLPR